MVKKSSPVSAVPDDAADPIPGTPAPVALPARPVLWRTAPQPHDYPAAASYLSLLAGRKKIDLIVATLRHSPVVYFKAKDILRASRLPLLPPENKHVAADLVDIADGTPLSPCLLVRGSLSRGGTAQIADGYHRVCASYYVDENTDIPVKIATL